MRFLVLGAGAIGGYFGGRLAESGADVTFLVRERRKADLDANGLVVKSAAGDIARAVQTLAAGAPVTPFDVVILSCKSYDLDAAMDAIAPALGKETAILPLLNGMRHLERLAARFGAAPVMGGTCYISLTLDESGIVHHIGTMQSLALGELSGTASVRAQAIAAAFAATKVELSLPPSIVQAMWEKWVMIAALAAASTLTRASVGAIVATASGERFMLDVIGECEAIAAAEGYPPSAASAAATRRLLTAQGSSFAASMMRDLTAGHRTEGEHVIGDLVDRAHAHGIVTPTLEAARVNLAVHEARLARA